jgi:hypothetical protein
MAIASKDRAHGRQWPLVAMQPFDISQLTNGTAVAAVKMPAGARVIGGGVIISTPFDASGNVINVGDGDAPNRYSATPVDVTAAGFTSLDVTGYKYTFSDYIDITWTLSGSPTEGAGIVMVQYVIDGRSNEVNPDYDL